jgi:ATP-dependent Lhr-like helicase
MDLDGLIEILDRMAEGSLKTVAVDTREPSPFCHEILNSNPYTFLDDAPLEERRTRAVQLRRTLPENASELGTLDAAAIAQVAEESWPVVRDEHELHDALLTLVVLPPVAEWSAWFEALRAAGRASVVGPWWVATERLGVTADVVSVLRGWMDSIGPVTVAALAERLTLPAEDVEIGLAKLESEGVVLRGKFTGDGAHRAEGSVVRDPALEEWCHRRVLARIHRLTLGRLRREIEPVTAAEYVRFLVRWQHVAHGTKLHGADGLLQVLRQLQGYEISAAAWEGSVLPQRIAKYEPELLDRLCLAGEVMWGRLSPHPALETASGRKVRPTRVAPLAIFLREDADKLLPPAAASLPLLSHSASDVWKALEARGASFFAEIVRTSGRLASEVEDGLWELVAGGLVTGDGFENLRALIDPKRRSGQGRGRSARPRHAAGRWALVERRESATDVEFFARQLLTRWGVVFRDVLARETLAPAWRELLQVYRRMEARGEIRGGRFVTGFMGEQFARPEALDMLRHVRRSEHGTESIEVSPADPLNLTGIILPGDRMGALSQAPVRVVEGADAERAVG